MRVWIGRLAPICLGVLAVAWACSPAPVKRGQLSGNNSGGTLNGSGGSLIIDMPDVNCDPKEAGSPCSPDAPAPPGCGDGTLTEDEACDDANRVDGDGCWANCLGLDPGYSCNPPGQPCHELVICGDSIVGTSEQCDDGNVAAGDGCSVHCHFEVGFKCEGSPSVCTPTTCGDGLEEGAESCDDSNAQPFDGCSSTCQTEPSCTDGGCTSECGDGLSINEECDDGNTKDGDGCSSACAKEPGFECSQEAECEMINGDCVLRVPVIYRDFDAAHTDFEVDCKGNMDGLIATPGLVQPDLVDGKPVATAAATASCITALGQWYSDAGSAAIVRDIVLFANGEGGFVNRFGPNGEQWGTRPVYTSRWCGNATNVVGGCLASPTDYFDGCNFDPATEQCWSPCTIPGGCSGCACAGTVTVDAYYDGTPLFFPIDDAPSTDARIDAKVPPQYGYTWPFEDQVLPVLDAPHVEGQRSHNFHFTTEVVYWFQYDATAVARLDFTGDDDVWVFVNGKLAVDLGGVHQPVDGTVTISAATEASYGLVDGNVYKITVFQAERKKESSSFRLTLDGFSTSRSVCTPICGDAVVSLGEQCDDGVNDGGYGECDAGCVIGAYCGDGTQQEGEQCDDGNRLDGDGCSSSCRRVVVK